MFWVYVLENPRGKFYVGQTENITARIHDHNRTIALKVISLAKTARGNLFGAKYTMQRERQIKRMKSARWIRANLLTFHSAVNPDESGL